MRIIHPILLAVAGLVSAQQPAFDPGPKPGTKFPAFSLPDQSGKLQTLESLRGPKGLMLVFHRSADWWPFCKTQLVELDQNVEALRSQGMGLAAISYDSVAILKHFSDRRNIRFPLLSDSDSKLIKALGILNPAGKEGTPFHGIPHPVTFVLDADGTIRHKYFEEDFRERPTLSSLLSKELGVNPAAAAATAKAKHVAISSSASTAIVSGGQRILLSVEIDIPKDFHLYAPGVEGYYAVDWKMTPSEVAKPHPVDLPQSRILYLQAIDEKVPVFEGKIRLLRDVTLAQSKVLSQAAGAGKQIQLDATLRYQACSDRMCFPPETVPLHWTLQYDPHDLLRVPPELRRK